MSGRFPVFVMDCDVAASFDDVSHHEIVRGAMEIDVPPVWIAVWNRECKKIPRQMNLDDNETPGICRTK